MQQVLDTCKTFCDGDIIICTNTDSNICIHVKGQDITQIQEIGTRRTGSFLGMEINPKLSDIDSDKWIVDPYWNRL